ncbi:GAF domain-containing protein [Chloroflexota bacterium]
MSTQTPLISPQKTSRFRRGRLARTILLLMLPLALVPTFIMGTTAYIRSRTLLLTQITDQLVNLADREADALDSWITTKHVRLNSVIRTGNFRSTVDDLLLAPPGSSAFSESRDAIIAQLKTVNPSISAAIFNQFIFVDPNGEIIIATRDQWQGLNLSDQEYFTEDFQVSEPVSIFLNQPDPIYTPDEGDEVIYEGFVDVSNEIVLITSIKLNDAEGEFMGYVIGISEAASIQRELEDPLSMVPNSKVFIITETGDIAGITLVHGFVLVIPSEGQLEASQTDYQEGQIATSYNTFDDLPVVGIKKFSEVLNIDILVEVPQSDALGQVNSLAPFTAWLLLITAIVLSLLIIYGTRRLLSPLNEVVRFTRFFADGDWMARAPVTRSDEIGLLAHSFNQMADELTKLYRSLEIEVKERTQQIVTAAEVAHIATSGQNLDEVLDRTVNLIIEQFNYYHAAIFLYDEPQENLILREATGQVGKNLKSQNYFININQDSIVSWVAKNNLSRVVSETQTDTMHLQHELLPETHSEVGIPIAIGQDVLGVLDVQARSTDAFDTQIVEVLTTLADQIASAIQNFRLLEGTEIDLLQINQLYRASRRIAKASTAEEIIQLVNTAIQSTHYIGSLYLPKGPWLELVEPTPGVIYADSLPLRLELSAEQTERYLPAGTPVVVKDVLQPAMALHTELLTMPQQLGCHSAAFLPVYEDGKLAALIIMGSRERGAITQTGLQPYGALVEITATALEKVIALDATQKRLNDLQVLTDFAQAVGNETDLNRLFILIHNEIRELIGDVYFYIALYDSDTQHIEIPYLFEGGEVSSLEPFPLGEGLTSILIRTRQPLMLIENTEERAKALGARIVGAPAKSWLGVPMIVAGEPVGVITIQDTENEHRFTEDDLRLMSTLTTQVASVIHSARLLEESTRRAIQLHTAAEIARDTSGTLDRDDLLRRAIHLVQDRFDFYHASVFLIDPSGEYAVIQESTGEAGRTMKAEGHRLEVGSQSIIGYATGHKQPLVVNDVTQDPTHRFNPLLPDTRAELGIPLMLGDRVLGALDVQSTKPYAFSSDDIEVLQILADQLAIAVANADLFSEIQEHLAQHRLIHHVTTVAASSTSLQESLASAVQGLRVTLGDRVAILMADFDTRLLRVVASAGYEDDVLGLQIPFGQGITGWVAENREPLMINDVLNDPRYIVGKDTVRAELAVPLNYRGELLGVLNVESDEINAFDQHDQDILGTLAGSLSAIVVNARLTERQRQLFDVTNKIRRSVNIETIMETTATELSKVLQTRKMRIQVGGETAAPSQQDGGNGAPREERPLYGSDEEGVG